MVYKIREYIDNLFASAPKTKKAFELKEEIIANLTEKYNDLVLNGTAEEQALNIVLSGIGDVQDLVKDLEEEESTPEDMQKQEAERKKTAGFVAIAVMLFITSPLWIILAQPSDEKGLVGFFVSIAIGVGLLIYRSMSQPKPVRQKDTMVEEFKEWSGRKETTGPVFKSLNSALWCIIVVLFFFIGYVGSFGYAWIIFLVGAAISNLLKAIFEVKK